MRTFVYLPFVACLIGVASARLVARRTDPRVSARVLVVSGIALAGATSAALSLLAFTAIARVPLVAAQGRWSASAVASKVHVPMPVGIAAIVCIVAIGVHAFRTFDGYRRGLGHALRLQLERGGEIVTVPEAASFAYACRVLPFRPGVIVVSEGLHHTLDADQRAAVLAHERSHLAHQHSVYELVALATGALNPLLRPMQRAVSFALERWADEDAAASLGRHTAASALAASALPRRQDAPASALAHGTSCVPARVEALLQDPRPHSAVLVVTTAVNAMLAIVAVILAAHSTELIFEALRRSVH